MLTHEVFDSYDIFEKDHDALLLKCAMIATPMMMWQLYVILLNINTSVSMLNLAAYIGVYNFYIRKIKQIENITPYIYALSILILLSGLFIINKIF